MRKKFNKLDIFICGLLLGILFGVAIREYQDGSPEKIQDRHPQISCDEAVKR